MNFSLDFLIGVWIVTGISVNVACLCYIMKYLDEIKKR